jgi:hypothetical protein
LEIHDSRYARASDGAYIAYQMTGEGPVDLTWELDWFGNLDAIWEEPAPGARRGETTAASGSNDVGGP